MAMSKERKDLFGGIPVRNNNDINISLFCEFCKLLLINPMQLLCCGTRLCRWCCKKGLTDSEPFICPFCQTKQPKKQVQADRAVERDLNTIKIECYSCSWNGSYKDYQEHLQQNHADFECLDCHTRFFTINSFEEHQQEICEYRCIPCGLPGCMEIIKWSELKTHYLSNKHQKLLVTFIIEYILWKRHQYYNSNRLTTISDVISNIEQGLTAIVQSIGTLSPGLEALSSDGTRLRSEHDQTKTTCEGIISQINETKKTVNDDNEKLIKHMQTQDNTEKEVDDTKKLYSSTNIPLLGDNGTITFSFHKHNDDISSPFSMFSPTFKTSSYGYVFSLRVCSTIESTNENQGYLSAYITLLRSDFDPVLFYPFPYSIFIYLYDQSGQGKHIESTIKPDSSLSSLGRPTSVRNDEVGIMKFCPLAYLTDQQSIYLRDGVFFVGIFIDFMNTGSIPFG